MNILLIGHEGYLGHGLLTYLSTKHKVIGWDKKENIFNLDASILAKENIELVINLSVMADRGSKPYQIDTPTENVNVMGAYHLARILKGSDITWIQFSTREVLGPVYGPEDVFQTPAGLRPKFLVDETQPYAPINFYGKSKIMAEFISESHPNSAVIRLTTGYTDFNHHGANWVLGLIRSIVKGDPVNLTRGGEQFRDPLHTDDLGNLIELIHQNKAFGEKYHAGGGAENLISLKEFVLIANPQIKINSVEGGDWGFAFNNQKANILTGWNPKKSIRESIPLIVQNVRRGD
jgi:nucleoside-diphosphate-sugar epimerase